MDDKILISDKELDEIDHNIRLSEKEGIKNILKYFDRIHDKLFTFNNILIAGYFALAKIFESIPDYLIIIPFLNLALLLFIEYRMMKKSRFEADVRNKTLEEIERNVLSINRTNLFSLLAIISTFIVAFIFVINLFSIGEVKVQNNPEPIKNYTDIIVGNENDYLLAISSDSTLELGSSMGYINIKGDTVIPIGKYSHCWTDTFRTYAIVFDKENTNSKTVGIDKMENVLFDVYFFDNWPDEISDGLFRVKRNGKIGYANEKGEVVIPCQFECAHPFENNKAMVTFDCNLVCADKDCEHERMESDSWFYIDKKGNRLKE
jgi:hypothetical protein